MSHPLRVFLDLALGLALCRAGKTIYQLFHPAERVDQELTAKDNLAFATSLGGYYLGILLALGAPLSGAAHESVLKDLALTAAWGLAAIALLNAASRVQRRLAFRGLDLSREVLERRNLSAGIVSGSVHAGNALLILGALGGEGGWLAGAVFWLYGQAWLTFSAAAFPRLLRYDLAAELKKDNRAAALASAGVLIATGNILRLALTGDFRGWSAGFASVTGYAATGLVALFLVRELVDRLLLPGVTIRQEILEQKTPNAGVGLLLALFYIGSSFLIGWCL